ncbi:MAG: helix-turn-helix domain-containing protein [Nocardioidaceae bacterium]|nr:helix-turn-helix domain-containing protein [Nocardioidaceae bacterium]
MLNKFLATAEAVAETVHAQRLGRGWSQAELAAKAGVGRRFVVDLEAGHPRAELAKVLSVLDALGVHALALPSEPVPYDLDAVDLDAVVERFA